MIYIIVFLLFAVVILAATARGYWQRCQDLKRENDQDYSEHVKFCTLLIDRAEAAEKSADLFAKLTREWIRVGAEAAQIVKDSSPPKMQPEHDALELYRQSLKHRPVPHHVKQSKEAEG